MALLYNKTVDGHLLHGEKGRNEQMIDCRVACRAACGMLLDISIGYSKNKAIRKRNKCTKDTHKSKNGWTQNILLVFKKTNFEIILLTQNLKIHIKI